jgi:hypothetical protein
MSTFGNALWGGAGGGTSAAPQGVPVKPLFYMALRLAHVTQRPQIGPSPDQLADCLQQAQLMIDQASVRRLTVYSIRLTQYTLGTNKIYTLEPGGTLVDANGNSNRPVKIEEARLMLSTTETPGHLKIWSGSFRGRPERFCTLSTSPAGRTCSA